jgi:hypothetical protein
MGETVTEKTEFYRKINEQAMIRYQQEIDKLADRVAALTAALESIAKNTCCDRCQEAALVARAALDATPGA